MFDINFIIIVNYKETYENFNICCTDGTYYPHFMDVPLCQNAGKCGCLAQIGFPLFSSPIIYLFTCKKALQRNKISCINSENYQL